MTTSKKINLLFCHRGQTIIEYTALLVIIMLGLIIMAPYVIRSWNAHVKGYEDSVKDSYSDPLEQTENPQPIGACQCEVQTPPDACQGDRSKCCGPMFGCPPGKTATSAQICFPNDCPTTVLPTCEDEPKCCHYVPACSEANIPYSCCGGIAGQPPCFGDPTCMPLKNQCDPSDVIAGWNHPFCRQLCTVPPIDCTNDPLNCQKYGDQCSGTEDNVSSQRRYTYVNQCSSPSMCEWKCNSPLFIPVNSGLDCDCSYGFAREKIGPGGLGTGILECACPLVAQGQCTDAVVHGTGPGQLGLPNDPSAIGYAEQGACAIDEAIFCNDGWQCCPYVKAGDEVVQPKFNQQAGNGRDCPAGSTMVGISARRYADDEDDDEKVTSEWRIFCRDIKKPDNVTSCFLEWPTATTVKTYPTEPFTSNNYTDFFNTSGVYCNKRAHWLNPGDFDNVKLAHPNAAFVMVGIRVGYPLPPPPPPVTNGNPPYLYKGQKSPANETWYGLCAAIDDGCTTIKTSDENDWKREKDKTSLRSDGPSWDSLRSNECTFMDGIRDWPGVHEGNNEWWIHLLQ